MKLNVSQVSAFAFGLILTGASAALAQDSTMPQGASAPAATRTVGAGAKLKLKGTIVDRNADAIIVRDQAGGDVTVLLTGTTNVKSKGGFFRRGTNYDVTNLLRGLAVEVE